MKRTNITSRKDLYAVYECFNAFLLSHGAFFKFYNYYTGSVADLLVLPPIDFLTTSFTWRLTDEGSSYWRKLHDRWISAYFEFINK
ncbi:hypothetical protein [Dipodfec virus UOA04_Rod_653]|nr:hypothetical protein [Dipodfec virus UOA04_Rod_653]